jgi:hypothetical protein
MSLMGVPWTALLDMHPQRSHQIAWFVYGWIEREYALNVTACADWWMRAAGLSAAQLKAPPKGIGNSVPRIETQVLAHNSDRAETNRHRSPRQVESLS